MTVAALAIDLWNRVLGLVPQNELCAKMIELPQRVLEATTIVSQLHSYVCLCAKIVYAGRLWTCEIQYAKIVNPMHYLKLTISVKGMSL